MRGGAEWGEMLRGCSGVVWRVLGVAWPWCGVVRCEWDVEWGVTGACGVEWCDVVWGGVAW